MITITTDFGYKDHYAGTLKGVILSINPRASVVEITHGIKRHSIRHASYVLRAFIDYFPEGTVHLFVVDPGVGTSRKGIVAELDNGYYVGPDNGILTLVSHRVKKVYEIKMSAKNPTFHGRDIFAPVAARIDMGIFANIEPIDDFVKFKVERPERHGNQVKGEILHIDHFGNVITNIPDEMVKDANMIDLHGLKIRMVKTYGEGKNGELIALINSENLLEFAVNQGSAELMLNYAPGDKIKVEVL